jgi:opacity protein-like surface antigen
MNRSPQSQPERLRFNWIRRPLQPRRFAWAAAILLISTAICLPSLAYAQSLPTATRVGDLQFGGGISFGSSPYNQNLSYTRMNLTGEAFYTAFDFRNHLGLEADFHQVHASEDSTAYQRTYEIGPRFHWTFDRLVPYGKILVGRGVFNYPGNIANLAYNLYTFGGGIDYNLTRSINVRGDYEYQNWTGFPLGTLHPGIATIGFAYHFHE